MFTFKVLPDGADSYEVTARSRDISRWEALPGKHRSLGVVEKDPTMGALEEICHLAARRQGLFDGSLGDFRESCDIEVAQGESTDPTQPDR